MIQDHEMNTPQPHKLAAGGIFLEGNWSVTYDGREVGHCEIHRIGLYYHFTSYCVRVSSQVTRLYLHCDGKEVDLGIFVPQEDRLILEKRVAIKHLPKGRPVFSLIIAGQRNTEACHFIPVCEDKPLQCLHELRDARFAARNGVVGIIIKD